MKHELISVIVPIYNVQAYLEPCIRSLLSQTDENLELILVDDGATDGSGLLAERLLAENSRYPGKVIHQKNAGVSAARNTGLAAAHGAFVVMVDADDTVSPDFVKTLRETAEKTGAPVVFCDYAVHQGGNVFSPPADGSTEVLSRADAQRRFLNRSLRLLLPTMLVRRDLLSRHEIAFDPQCRFGEDVHFLWAVLCFADKLAFRHETHYDYLLRPQSTMTASGVEKILTGCRGLLRLRDTYVARGDCVPELRAQLVPRGLFGSLHSAAKIMDFSTFRVLTARLDFPKWRGEMLRCSDARIFLIVLVLTLCPRAGYEILKRF